MMLTQKKILPSSLSSKVSNNKSGGRGVGRVVVKRRTITKRNNDNNNNTISAVFERFTERAIKSVMLAQLEAKENPSLTEVTPACLVIGLMVEAKDDGEHGFLNTGVSVGRAREVLKDIAAASASASASLDDDDSDDDDASNLFSSSISSSSISSSSSSSVMSAL